MPESHRPTSASGMFLRVLGVLFLAEIVVMVGLSFLPPLSPWAEAIVDATALAFLVSPLFWLWLVKAEQKRRQAEAALRKEHESFLMMFESAADALVVADRQGRIAQVNRMAEKLFGYDRAELVGQPIEILMPERGRAQHVHTRERYQAAPEARAMGSRGDLRARRKDGSQFPTDIMLSPVETADGAMVIATVRDITERVAAAKKLQEASEEIAQTNAQLELAISRANAMATEAMASTVAKSSFLASMSHEIRTPMNAVIGMTGLLLDSPLSDEQREFAETIRSSSDQLLALINDILDFSKIEAGKLVFEDAVVDLRDCVETAFDLVGARAAEKKLDLLYWIEPGAPAAIRGDITRLRQILVNLVGNAVKFTARGEIVVTLSSVSDPAASDQPRLRVSVRDTGIGISPEGQERLFRAFSQVDASTTRKYGGTGLGLAISQRLVALMGGRIWVESQLGRGSTFTFELPFVAAELPADSRHHTPAQAREFASRRILIIDDNETTRGILARQSEAWSLQPRVTASASEAIAWLARGDPCDAVLIDRHMPEQDGYDVARAIRRHRTAAELPIFILAPAGSRETPPEDLGISIVLGKPFKPSVLFNSLQRVWLGRGGPTPATTQTIRRLAETLPLRILLAEDNAVNQRVATLLLGRMGYRADIAANGREALAALARQPYDVILLDVHMPEMDGLECAREICQRYPADKRPRLIATTANAMQGDREECLAAGMDDYVTKPIRPEALVAALAKCARDAEA